MRSTFGDQTRDWEVRQGGCERDGTQSPYRRMSILEERRVRSV